MGSARCNWFQPNLVLRNLRLAVEIIALQRAYSVQEDDQCTRRRSRTIQRQADQADEASLTTRKQISSQNCGSLYPKGKQ
jgi:hypothetical protein